MSQEQSSTYYDLLSLPASASMQQIRRAYRELSKRYHPDTTALPAAIATEKFQALNEAYATLSSPERRSRYDLKIGYSRVAVVRPLEPLNAPSNRRSSAYLDPTDRPLSAGELFALFILVVTFLVCLLLVATVGITRGEAAFQSFNPFNPAQVAPPIAPPTAAMEPTIPGELPELPSSDLGFSGLGNAPSDRPITESDSPASGEKDTPSLVPPPGITPLQSK